MVILVLQVVLELIMVTLLLAFVTLKIVKTCMVNSVLMEC